MPEGDTTWRTARALHAALAGKTVVAFASSLDLTGVVQRGPRLRDGESGDAGGIPGWHSG